MKWPSFKRKKKLEHNIGNIYVVERGTYGGDYIVLFEIDYIGGCYKFMTLPDFSRRDIDFDVLERGISFKIVTFLEKLPEDVFETCKQQYESINNNI